MDGLTGSSYFGKNYNDAQMLGDTIYPAAYYAGYNQVTTQAVTFNAVEALIFNPGGGRVEWRLYMGNKCIVGAYGNTVSAANTLLPDYSGFIDDFQRRRARQLKLI